MWTWFTGTHRAQIKNIFGLKCRVSLNPSVLFPHLFLCAGAACADLSRNLKTLSCPTVRYFRLSVHLSVSFTFVYCKIHVPPHYSTRKLPPKRSSCPCCQARALSPIYTRLLRALLPIPLVPQPPLQLFPRNKKSRNSSILRPPPPIALRRRESGERASESEGASERASESLVYMVELYFVSVDDLPVISTGFAGHVLPNISVFPHMSAYIRIYLRWSVCTLWSWLDLRQ
jgi:hypothetical protein